MEPSGTSSSLAGVGDHDVHSALIRSERRCVFAGSTAVPE